MGKAGWCWLEEARALLRMDVTSVEGVTSTSLLEVSKPFHPRGTDITRKDATDSVARRRSSRPTYKPGPADLRLSDLRPLNLWHFGSEGAKDRGI